jgi:hypothetical protein
MPGVELEHHLLTGRVAVEQEGEHVPTLTARTRT